MRQKEDTIIGTWVECVNIFFLRLVSPSATLRQVLALSFIFADKDQFTFLGFPPCFLNEVCNTAVINF